jgi:hypothetical protein
VGKPPVAPERVYPMSESDTQMRDGERIRSRIVGVTLVSAVLCLFAVGVMYSASDYWLAVLILGAIFAAWTQWMGTEVRALRYDANVEWGRRFEPNRVERWLPRWRRRKGHSISVSYLRSMPGVAAASLLGLALLYIASQFDGGSSAFLSAFARVDQAILGLFGSAIVLCVPFFVRRMRRHRPRSRFRLVLRDKPLMCGRKGRVTIVARRTRDSKAKLDSQVVCTVGGETLYDSTCHTDCEHGAAEVDLALPEGLPGTSFESPRIAWLLHVMLSDEAHKESWQIPVEAGNSSESKEQ